MKDLGGRGVRAIKETRGDPGRERQWYKVRKGVQAGIRRDPLGHVKEFGFSPKNSGSHWRKSQERDDGGTARLVCTFGPAKQRTGRGRFGVGTDRLVSELLQWCQMRNANGLVELEK